MQKYDVIALVFLFSIFPRLPLPVPEDHPVGAHDAALAGTVKMPQVETQLGHHFLDQLIGTGTQFFEPGMVRVISDCIVPFIIRVFQYT